MAFLQKLLLQMGAGRALLMAAVGLALLGALTMVVLRGPSAQLGYLYSDLDPENAAAIGQKLAAQNVEYRLSPDGTAIMAPQDRLAELRMSLAGDQLGGKIGYEVLDAEQPFGLSAAREKMNETRAIEGELAKSIGTLDAVNSARVRIVMPEKALFAREERKASAAITLKTRGRLSEGNVAAIRNLVASSVPDLAPEAVSIIDQQGRLLARAGDADGGSGEADERQGALENRLRNQIESLLEPLVGAGKVRAEVSAEVDREARREEAHLYDPDKQVISRQISVESGDRSQETAAPPGGVTVGNQLPNAQAAPVGPGDQRQANSNQTSEDTTYDNSRTDTVTQRAPGAIKKLSVAVMVDSGAKPIPPAQLQKMTRIVERAVGYDAERGDTVVVDAMPFIAPDAAEEGGFDVLSYIPTARIFPLFQLLLVAGVGLMVLRMLRGKPGAFDGGLSQAASPTQPQIGVDGQPIPFERQSPSTPPPPALANPSHMAAIDQEIAMAQVEGGIKASSLKRIGETIATSPAESASVIRQWMNA